MIGSTNSPLIKEEAKQYKFFKTPDADINPTLSGYDTLGIVAITNDGTNVFVSDYQSRQIYVYSYDRSGETIKNSPVLSSTCDAKGHLNAPLCCCNEDGSLLILCDFLIDP